MNKLKINYFVDIGLLISFVICFFTGLLKWHLVLGLMGLSFNDLPMLQLSNLHDWSGFVMGILVLIHLVLHWRWMVNVTKVMFKKKEVKE